MLNLLKLPKAKKIFDLDDPQNIKILREIIRRKPFLLKTYRKFYQDLLARINKLIMDGKVIELGSGASLLKEYSPKIVTSDILPYEGVDMVFSALEMPFEDNSLEAIVMIDVLHHVKDPRQFFQEGKRCLQNGGKLIMIEPANTYWSSFIYKNFHHEPFKTHAEWGVEEGGPISGANMAIPWIIFYRDRQLFQSEFLNLIIRDLKVHIPLSYLISGGLSIKQLLPSPLYPLILLIEWLLIPFNRYLGMFLTIELEKVV